MTSAWEAIRGDARRSPRYQLRLTASVLIYQGIGELHATAALAYTRDISRGGLCLVIPDPELRILSLVQEPHPLRITLALLTGTTVKLVGETIYILPYRAGDYGREYLVGVKLSKSDDVGIYHEFVDAFARGDRSWRFLCPAVLSCAYTLLAASESMI